MGGDINQKPEQKKSNQKTRTQRRKKGHSPGC